jgi:hypothetical protein
MHGGHFARAHADMANYDWRRTVGLAANRTGHYNTAWGYCECTLLRSWSVAHLFRLAIMQPSPTTAPHALITRLAACFSPRISHGGHGGGGGVSILLYVHTPQG